MIKEKWKSLIGYDYIYQVSNLGNVRRLLRDEKYKVLKPQLTTKGYCRVMLIKDKKAVYKRTHVLVAESFLGERPIIPHADQEEFITVNHKNLNKKDNRVSNLEWCTARNNRIHYQNNRIKA